MTSFHGGKQRIGKRLAETIVARSLAVDGFIIRGYCEPFCGMLGVYRHLPGLLGKQEEIEYKAGDASGSIVEMWRAAVSGWVPPTECTEEEYGRLKESEGASALKGFVGHQYSYGGQYFKGFIGRYGRDKPQPRAAARVTEIAAALREVDFTTCDYQSFSDLEGYIIYCDPPYAQTECRYEGAKGLSSFDSERFWGWCRNMARKNLVFISEFTAPDDFETVFESSCSSNVKGQPATGKEKLFFQR